MCCPDEERGKAPLLPVLLPKGGLLDCDCSFLSLFFLWDEKIAMTDLLKDLRRLMGCNGVESGAAEAGSDDERLLLKGCASF